MKNHLSNLKLVVSPMAGVTDAPFRHIAIKYGADYGISEMITSQIELWDSQKTQQRLKSNFTEPLKIIQIAGASPDVITDAAKLCEKQNIDAIEINMGCPAKKVCNVLAGSALLRDEKLVEDILLAVVSSVSVPVFLKTRLGWDHDNKNIMKIAQLAELSGIKSLAIHGRTRSDMYNGDASFDLIREVIRNSTIPVFANGDITSAEKAIDILDYTNASGLYIGRGALGKPWLFMDIKNYISGLQLVEKTPDEILLIMNEHIPLIHDHYGDYMGVRFARKHVKWYLQANKNILSNLKISFESFSKLETCEEQLAILQSWQQLYS
ncbi:MAG: tRNA dihydrouridine synthase DusB [Burkholderiales bacterium]|nr:tRNA dihydrouridine synthase DusB [Burkholderiales bacterium]